MPIEIEAFLTAYHPKFICVPCLAVVTERTEGDVRGAVMALVAEGRAATSIGECLNCNSSAFVVLRRTSGST